jgi:dihydropteroate synthase
MKLYSKNIQKRFVVKWGDFKLDLSRKTHIMGILNRTPDSFFDGGRFMDIEAAVKRVREIVSEGADIVDIGGESTRPGSEAVTADTEIERTVPLIDRVAKDIDVPISIDTSKGEVAEAAIKSGASIINDVSGLKADNRMAKVASSYDVPVIVMHMRGTPKTMQADPRYDALMDEIIENLRESIDIAKSAGIDEEKIIVDPGIGFGKTVDHNLTIISNLDRLKILNKPVLIGVSRKSFIANVLKDGGISPSEIENSGRLVGTIASSTVGVMKGAHILRVHDVKEAVQAAKIYDALLRN